MESKYHLVLALILSFTLAGCSFNPFTTDNHLTGSGTSTAVGAAVGVGTTAVIGQTTKTTPLAIGGAVGALVGYYVSTLRFASGGIIHGGGQVFTLGDYVSIDLPTDNLFDVNTAEFLDDVKPVLDSVVAVLKRSPKNNIIVSGDTSGFGTTKFQLVLSEARARQVAAYLWAHGIGQFQCSTLSIEGEGRQMYYTGYGDFFPIANHIHNDSIRQNSRIQITSYPILSDNIYTQFHLSKNHRVYKAGVCTSSLRTSHYYNRDRELTDKDLLEKEFSNK